MDLELSGKSVLITRHQVEVTTHAHDLSDSRQVDALFEATQDVDIRVNNNSVL